jgi:uncharacterized protein DUF955
LSLPGGEFRWPTDAVFHDGEFIDTEDNFRTSSDPDQPWDNARVKEWEANTFAAALLMPENLVCLKWAEIDDVEGITSWFQVSRQAMTIRLHAAKGSRQCAHQGLILLVYGWLRAPATILICSLRRS